MISTSPYRTIFRGYDNESGCEIAWNVYSLEKISHGKLYLRNGGKATHFRGLINWCLDDRVKIKETLDSVKQLRHPNILTCIHYLMKETELVMITELITAGSIRE